MMMYLVTVLIIHMYIINNNKFVSYFLPVLLFSDLVYWSIPIQSLCDTSGIQNHVTCDNSVGSRKVMVTTIWPICNE